MLIFFSRRDWIWSKKKLDKVRRRGYKQITWPVRYARVMAKRVGGALS
jgi:hypothetical protein